MSEIMQYAMGKDPDRDAWLTNFFTENHLAYETFPDMVASPEQLNFIIHMDGEHFYYPCSDELFAAIVEKRADTLLTSAYYDIWSRLEQLVNEVIESEFKRKYLLSLLSIKFQHETTSKVLLPERLEKRLLAIFTTISEINRPLATLKENENRRAVAYLESNDFLEAYNSLDGLEIQGSTTLKDIDLQLHLIRLRRLMLLSSISEIWRNDDLPDPDYLRKVMNRTIEAEGWVWLCNWLRNVLNGERSPYILWIGGRSGEIVFDLAMIRILMKIGIKVIFTVKQAFFYHRISCMDLIEDPVLEELIEGAEMILEPKISKKKLLRYLHRDKRLLIISDGTREQFNPLLTSVTFARAFKEADLVISRCPGSRQCLRNRFRFTRDLVSIIHGQSGEVDILFKSKHVNAVRFSESALRKKAASLIGTMKNEKEKGKAIMFYSAIVGSIPGQLETAKKILNVFVKHLRSTLNDVVIINPDEHFEEGMDADDIMYMWEIFQRSGLIDIWRFQTMADIEKSFALMGEKVPPEWTGKDATYSTGCTKEMEIAMGIQKKYPEMQLIGPSWEKFLRRKEYGIGKLYDRALAESK